MMSDLERYHLQNLWLILGICLFAALLLAGILLRRTRFWDRDKTLPENQSLSRKAGTVLLSIGGLGGGLCLLFLLANAAGLL